MSEIDAVLVWSGVEDWLRTGDSTQADITAKGFVAGLGRIEEAYEASESEAGPRQRDLEIPTSDL